MFTTEKIADALFDSGCIKFGLFKIKSGIISPYYIDLACLLSSPKKLKYIADLSGKKINEMVRVEKIDKLASIELKGALIAPIIACVIEIPCIIVRKEEKNYGAKGRIAGAEVNKGDKVLFFDDVVSEGISKVEGIKPLKERGADVKNLFVVVNREQGGKENLEKRGYKVHELIKITELVESLVKSKKIATEHADNVTKFVKKINNVESKNK